MKSFSLLTFALFFSLSTFSQKKLGVLKTISTEPDTFSIFPVGDSALISFKEQRMTRFAWVSPTGKIRPTYQIPPNLLHIDADSSRLNYYYLDARGERLFIRAAQQVGTKLQDLKGDFTLYGKVVTKWSEGGYFYLMLYREDLKILNLLIMHGLEILSDKKFPVPPYYQSFIENSIRFSLVEKDSPMQTFWTPLSGGLRLYKDGQRLFILGHDENQLKIFKCNLNDETVSETYIEHAFDSRTYTSYYYDGKVFLMDSKASRFRLSAYDALSTLRIADLEETVNRKDTSESKMFYKRVAHKKEITRGSFLHSTFTVPTNDQFRTLAVFAGSDGKIYLQCGAYAESSNVPIIFLPFGLARLALLVATIEINAASEGRGSHRYAYYTFEGNAFAYASDPQHVRRRLDDYEIANPIHDESPRVFQGYGHFNKGVLGIYHGKKSKSVYFVYFD